MKLLLDTHAFLWFVTNDKRLSVSARLLIANTVLVYVSMASLAEICIKVGIGKLELPEPVESFVLSQLMLNRFQILPITPAHAFGLAQLPQHHKDPFDRILVVQSNLEGMQLVSVDGGLDQYEGINRLW